MKPSKKRKFYKHQERARRIYTDFKVATRRARVNFNKKQKKTENKIKPYSAEKNN